MNPYICHMDFVTNDKGVATTHDCSDSWNLGDEEDNDIIDELFDTLKTQLNSEKNGPSVAKQHQQQQTLEAPLNIPSRNRSIRKRTRNVHFRENIMVIPCNESDDRMAEDCSVCWYTCEEMETIFNSILKISELSNRYDEKELKAVQDCLRGLEDVKRLLLLVEGETRKNSQQRGRSLNKRKKRKLLPHQKFIKNILSWQYDQRGSGLNLDPTGLMMFAATCSRQSRDEAIARAAQDFVEVQKIWNIKDEVPHHHRPQQHQYDYRQQKQKHSSFFVSGLDGSVVKQLGCHTQSVAAAASPAAATLSLHTQLSVSYGAGKQSHDYSSYF